MAEPKTDVVVGGGGTAGLTSAAALSCLLPGRCSVRFIESETIGLVGVGEATLPHIRALIELFPERPIAANDRDEFNRAIDLDHDRIRDFLILHYHATMRSDPPFRDYVRTMPIPDTLSKKLDLWRTRGRIVKYREGGFLDPRWVAVYLGQAGVPEGWGPRAEPVESAASARSLDALRGNIASDLPRYQAMLRAFALHVGARAIVGEIARVVPDTGEGIAAVDLADGSRMVADLFVDATGPDARLRSALDDARDDWSVWLPCDRVLFAEGSAETRVLTAVAHPAGWRWSSSVQSGFAYASGSVSDAEAARVLHDAAGTVLGDPIRIRPGTRPQPWRGNCIAIGDAATEIDPLERCNLHLVHSTIDRLIAMLPGRISIRGKAEFNRQTLAEAERVRDFLGLRYNTARRGGPLWQAAAAAAPPASLALTLAQFIECGRLPFYEEVTVARDSWAVVLIGQGVLPRRINPFVAAVPATTARAAMTRRTTEIAAALPHIPSHAAYRAAQTRHLLP